MLIVNLSTVLCNQTGCDSSLEIAPGTKSPPGCCEEPSDFPHTDLKYYIFRARW
jgi:hypothetical protein